MVIDEANVLSKLWSQECDGAEILSFVRDEPDGDGGKSCRAAWKVRSSKDAATERFFENLGKFGFGGFGAIVVIGFFF